MEKKRFTIFVSEYYEIVGHIVLLYLFLSCRCRAGCSCRAHRSTCHPHGQWSPHSPRRLRRSYPAGSPSSSHIPELQKQPFIKL